MWVFLKRMSFPFPCLSEPDKNMGFLDYFFKWRYWVTNNLEKLNPVGLAFWKFAWEESQIQVTEVSLWIVLYKIYIYIYLNKWDKNQGFKFMVLALTNFPCLSLPHMDGE